MFEVLPFDFYDRKSILEWYEIRKEIDFSPKYQRGSHNVWDLEMKQLLIDSIINEFDIPKFYFHLLNNNNIINSSKKRYAIIDGKQRLSCIFDFIEGEFCLSNDFIYFRDKKLNLSGLKYKDILNKYPDIAYNFQKFMIDVVYVITDEEDKVELFFSRLNSGKPLNNSEKRKAMIGFLNDKIEEVINENRFFRDKLAFKNNRNAYNDIMAKLILLEMNNGFLNMDKKTLDKLYNEFRCDNKEINKIIDSVEQNLYKMNKIFRDKDPLLKVKSSIPVYYWLIRNIDINKSLLRNLLAEFDQMRKNSNDIGIVEYNKYQQKGTDKKISMEYRYEFLIKWLDDKQNRLKNDFGV